jgi:hypothetical protein
MSSDGGRVWSTLLADGLVVWASKPSVADFTGLGLKTRTEVPRRNGRHVAALKEFVSRRNYPMKGAVAVR